MPEPDDTARPQLSSRPTGPVSDDPRLAFVYPEALRGLLQQQAAVESLHSRAATLVFATAFASSLLGGRALADGLGFWDWTGLVLLFAIGVLTVFLLWPYYNLSFRFDAAELLADYVDSATPYSMSDMHRALRARPNSQCSSRSRTWPVTRRSRCGSRTTGTPTARLSGSCGRPSSWRSFSSSSKSSSGCSPSPVCSPCSPLLVPQGSALRR